VSKGLVVACGVGSVVGWAFHAKASLLLDPHALAQFQLWRLFTHNFIFQGIGELIFGVLLLHYMRLFERQMGSVRYAVRTTHPQHTHNTPTTHPQHTTHPLCRSSLHNLSSIFSFLSFFLLCIFCSSDHGHLVAVTLADFVSVCLLQTFAATTLSVSTLLEVAVLALYRPSPRLTFGGPYGLIFSSLVLFYKEIPPFYRFKLAGVPLTDKVFTYLLLTQLCFTNSPSSTLAALCGLLAGLLYTTDSVGLSRLSLPGWLIRLCRRFVVPWLDSPPSARTRARAQLNPSLLLQANNNRRRMPGGAATHLDGQGEGQAPLDPAAIAALQQLFMQQQQQIIQQQQQMGMQPSEANVRVRVDELPVNSTHSIDDLSSGLLLQALEGMGFSREQATSALRQHQDNLDLAVASLLDN